MSKLHVNFIGAHVVSMCHACSYDSCGRKGDYGYEIKFRCHLEDIIRDLDKRIVRGRARLDRSATAKIQGDEEVSSERLIRLNAQIHSTLVDVSVCGVCGVCGECGVCLYSAVRGVGC